MDLEYSRTKFYIVPNFHSVKLKIGTKQTENFKCALKNPDMWISLFFSPLFIIIITTIICSG